MARIVAAMAAVHTPLLTYMPQVADAATWDKINSGFGSLRKTLADSGADTLVVFSDEHFNALTPRCYPSFGVATGDQGVGPVEVWVGIPRNSITVNFEPELAESILNEGVRKEFDLARIGGQVGLDHGFFGTLHFLTPQWDLSYVWIIQNMVVPPRPGIKRCYDFGRMVGEAIRSWDSPRRVAVLGTGGLSHAIGTPETGKISPEFDRWFLDLLCENGPALREISDADIEPTGNGTHEIRNWIAVAGTVPDAKGEVVMYEETMGVGFGMMRFQVD